MPIFEFRCLQCNALFEFLLKSPDEKVELRCPKCNSEQFERVLSTTGYTMASGTRTGVRSQTRNCSSGSCTTWEVPGHSR